MKNVVITGSTRGIGLAMAVEFLKAGCNVTLSGRGEALSKETLDMFYNFSGKYIYIPCNVQEKSSLQNLWDASVSKWGKVDIWINNAGQNAPHKFSWETGETYTENTIKTNITGMIFGSQISAAGMLEQGYGAIYRMESTRIVFTIMLKKAQGLLLQQKIAMIFMYIPLFYSEVSALIFQTKIRQAL